MGNSVFISYRRSISGYSARAVFQNLHSNGIDVFMDIETLDSGEFPQAILHEISARPYFLVILAPGCLERCVQSDDWLRREIEHALDTKRIIIPLLTSNFDFSAAYAHPFLTGKLATLPTFNAVNMPLDYFDEALTRLRTRFLKPTHLQSTPLPKAEKIASEHKIAQVAAEPPVTEQQLTAQQYFEHGLARGVEDLDGQIGDYTQAIHLDAQFSVVYNNRGIARKAKGDLKSALEDFDQAIGLNPHLATYYNNRGLALKASGDIPKALADYDQAIGLNPALAEAYFNRSDARREHGDFRGALADCNKLLSLNGEDAEAYNSRGVTHFKTGNMRGALKDFDQAIRLNPRQAAYYNNRGLLHKRKKDAARACIDFQQALALEPNHSRSEELRRYIATHCR